MSTVDIKNVQGKVIGQLNTEGLSPEEVAERLKAYIVVPKNMAQIVSEKMQQTFDFGNTLKKQFIDENVLLGISQRGLTSHVRKSMREVNDAIGSGSLKDAITEIIALEPAHLDEVVMSEARLLAFRNKIEAFLNVPQASSWNEVETWKGN